jgi:hypothetical protein
MQYPETVPLRDKEVALILCLDSELPDGGVSVVRSYAEFEPANH